MSIVYALVMKKMMLFFLLLSTFAAAGSFGDHHLSIDNVRPREPLDASGKEGDSFDYIIIGGGTAGLVMATRLAERHNNTVAVIEAGGFYENNPTGNLSVIPADDVYYAGSSPSDTDPLIDWGFVTTPQSSLNGRKLHYARGKTLGGSSARNYFTYQRGTEESYNRWASEVGDKSYEFSSILPYLKKSVDFTPPDNAQRAENASMGYNPSAFASGAGPLQVSSPIFANPFSSVAKEAFLKLGFSTALDFVSGTLFGVQYNMNTIDPKDQSRSSSQTSFLNMAINSTRIKVYHGTLAKKIDFDGKEARGVLMNTNSTEITIYANKEVVLSAGAFQSPQMLMISGVGPSDVLERYGIPVVSNLQGVGQNMWDHFLFGTSYQVTTLTHSALGNPYSLQQATAQYRANGSGLLGNPGGDLLAWEKLPESRRKLLSPSTQASLAKFPPDWPEVEYLILDAYSGDNENYITGAPQTPYMYVSPAAAIVAPQSRGNVSISSADSADPPLISPNWLSHPADQELAVAAFKRIRELMATELIKSVTVGDEIVPGPKVVTDADILYHIKMNGIEAFHASATCKMGQKNDSMAVVDSQARVFGTKGLRVVDISAFPFLPPGHPQSTVYALAEKISDIMLEHQ